MYAGYPLLLWLLRALGGARPVAKAEVEPPVTLVISAYNEEAVIDAKLDNSLALDYPRQRLQVMVVSDACEDRTDDIVSLLRRSRRDAARACPSAAARPWA